MPHKIVAIHPALEALWKLFDAVPPEFPTVDRSPLPIGSEGVPSPPEMPPDPLRPFEAEEARRWHRRMARLQRLRAACPHAEPMRVRWADRSVTSLCAACGAQGHPVAILPEGRVLRMPDDLDELLERIWLRGSVLEPPRPGLY
jgi:hypothetical protein